MNRAKKILSRSLLLDLETTPDGKLLKVGAVYGKEQRFLKGEFGGSEVDRTLDDLARNAGLLFQHQCDVIQKIKHSDKGAVQFYAWAFTETMLALFHALEIEPPARNPAGKPVRIVACPNLLQQAGCAGNFSDPLHHGVARQRQHSIAPHARDQRAD